jgi:tetratricopeptide (TPR) repeat protein
MRARLTAAAPMLLFAGLIALARPALADTTVIGNGFAADCSQAAKAASASVPPGNEAIRECDLAIENEVLSPHDLAATHVNRGVLYLATQNFATAKRDFDEAIRIEPGLGEAYVNRGAALIGMGQYRDGIADIDRGLALNPGEPEKAWFNRALAEERLDDLKDAYADYQKALELKPDWPLAKAELARFHVVQK